MEKKTRTILITCIALLAFFVCMGAFLTYLVISQKNTIDTKNAEIEQKNSEIAVRDSALEFDKQQSIAELEDLQHQYDEFYTTIGNDSLLKLFDEEQQKVQQLLQELKIVKSTNTKRIAELKKELDTVRGVLKSYVAKVDSLNALNTTLKAENKEVKRQYEERGRQLQEKIAQAEELDKQITLAKILEATDISLSTLNSKGKKANSLKKIAKLQIDFKILRNITAERGRKSVYIRISDSNENLLPSNTHNLFSFEGNELEYSAKKDFDFDGETQQITIFFPVIERLQNGTYTIAIFTDGNLIGEKKFKLE